MPWKKNKGGGFSTKNGGNIDNPKQYEALKEQGMSKEKAARITNAQSSKSKGRAK